VNSYIQLRGTIQAVSSASFVFLYQGRRGGGHTKGFEANGKYNTGCLHQKASISIYATLMMDFPLTSTTGTTFGAVNLVGLLFYTNFFTLFGKNAPKETPTKIC
jgi:hypothetical protein